VRLNIKTFIKDMDNYSMLRFYKIDDILKFRNFIYNDGGIYLNRKKIIFDQL
jgi:hypothetical protein